MNMISLTGLTPKTWIERGDSLFSVDLGKRFRGELAFHSGGDGLGILTNSFSFLLQFNCNGMLSRFWGLLFHLSRFALGSAIGALGRGGIRTHGSQKLRLISSHASANSDRIDDRFEYATKRSFAITRPRPVRSARRQRGQEFGRT
jgi:hypothetical protein